MHASKLWDEFSNSSKPYRGPVDPKQFDYATHISLQYKYLYFETPKAACSTIKSSLQKMELRDPEFYRENFEDIHKRDFSPLLKASQVGRLDNFLGRTDIYKFCFVRNPYTRLLSAYLDKIVHGKPAKIGILKRLGHQPSEMHIPISFDEFVRVVCMQPISEMDPHWRIQYHHTCQEYIQYDTIGRIEQFDADFTRILRNISSDYRPYFSSEQRHYTGSHNKLSQYYDQRLCELVRKAYAVDFEAFGYSKALPRD